MKTILNWNRYLRLVTSLVLRAANLLSPAWHVLAAVSRGLWRSFVSRLRLRAANLLSLARHALAIASRVLSQFIVWVKSWLASRSSIVWVWAVSVTLLVVFGILEFSAHFPPFRILSPFAERYDNDSIRYLLSSIFQGLAAVFALVFTISLVIGQTAARYSYRMFARIYNIPTFLYGLLFIASILLPLLVLGRISSNGDVPLGLVHASLLTAAASVIFLLPYFWSFKRWLSPEAFVQDMSRNLVRQLKRLTHEWHSLSDEERKRRQPQELMTMREVIKTARASMQYDVFDMAIRVLSSVALVANRRIHPGKIHGPTLGLVNNVIEELAREAKTEEELEILTEAVAENSKRAEKERLWRAKQELIQCLRVIIDIAIERKNQNAVENAVSGLGLREGPRLSGFSDTGLVDTCREIAGNLHEIGIEAAHAGMDYVPGQCAGELRILCEQLYEAKAADLSSDSLSRFVSEIVGALVAIGKLCIEMKFPYSTDLVMAQLSLLENFASFLYADRVRSQSEFSQLKSKVRSASDTLHKLGGK